jgi:hypothetical protein
MSTVSTKPSLSGGELAEPIRSQLLALRAKIQAEADVHEVIALVKLKDEDRWLYLIKTPFASQPKFVIGSTDAENTSPELLFKSGTEWSAQDEWTRIVELADVEGTDL